MSSLRLCLTLLFAATFQQGQAKTLSNPGVLLECNRSVNVEARGTVTLTCIVTYNLEDPAACKARDLTCNDAIISKPYIKRIGNHDIMSVNISQVQKMGNYTFKVKTTCGADDFTVQINRFNNKRGVTDEFWNVKKPDPKPEPEPEWESRIPAVLAVCFIITGLCIIILCFLFRTRRRRQVIRNMMTCNTQDDLSDTDSVVDKTPLNPEPQTP
ncbi:uncharacterized protein LOC130161956 [Seriola aureovittata]|uniref:uncharacterized protein LOC130161956 n=1 Tax=Seriola aureovittata TaxID=2871759 RepID=UPI0024BEFF80|nr:uncharacterized protein LOC130161956 [Seriola aureovittata]